MAESKIVRDVVWTKRYLQIPAHTFAGSYAVRVRGSADIESWTVNVSFLESTHQQLVKTVRGETKTWKNIGSAIAFVQENSASAKTVTLHVGDWQFSRDQPQ